MGDDELLDAAGAAAVLGIRKRSLQAYDARGQFIEPDKVYGTVKLWRKSRVLAWAASRPGRGWHRRREQEDT